MIASYWPKTLLAAFTLAICTQPVAGQTIGQVGSQYIPVDAVATVVVSVADTMESPMAEMYPTEIADAWCQENIGFPAHAVERLKVVLGVPGPTGPMFAVVVMLNADIEAQTLKPAFIDSQNSVDVDGHLCYPLIGEPNVVVHLKDARTLVLASPNYLDTVLRSASGSGSGSLAKLAAGVPHNGNMTALVAVEPVRPMLNGLLQMQAEQIPPPFAEFMQVPDLLDAVMFRLKLKDQESGLSLIMLARDDDSAEKLSGIITRGLEMGRQIALAQAMGSMPGDDAVTEASRQYAQRIGDKVVEAMTPRRNGRRLAITGSASQGLATQGVLVGLLLPAVQAAREAARRMSSSNNFKQIALAIHNYHAAYRELPADIKADDGTPLLSWRVAILPFIEEATLYEQLHLDEPWDSPHNIKLLEQMPAVFDHPGIATPPGTTVYQRPVGERYMDATETHKFRDILDGLSNTIMGVESTGDGAVEWTKPADIALDPNGPLDNLIDGTRPGFHVLMADGAVIFFENDVDPELFLHLLTRAGKEVIPR